MGSVGLLLPPYFLRPTLHTPSMVNGYYGKNEAFWRTCLGNHLTERSQSAGHPYSQAQQKGNLKDIPGTLRCG